MTELTTAQTAAVSFDVFYRQHFAALTRLAGLLGADDPQDVAQEALSRLHARRHGLRDPEAAAAYVRSTVCNLSRSRLRHLGVVRRFAPRLLPVPVPSPEETAVDNDETRRVLVALATLPPRQREVLTLRYWMGLSEREIADSLGISAGSVKTHASRGLASGHEAAPTAALAPPFAAMASSPLAVRIAASEVSLGSDVFIWGGERTTVSYKAPKTGVAAASGRASAPKLLSDGAIYSSGSDLWHKVARSPLSARLGALAVRTPEGVLVVGGTRTDDLLHADLRSGALYEPVADRWTTIPDAPFCPHLAVPQGSLVYVSGTQCDQDATPAFGWYDVTQKRWHVGPVPVAGTRQLFPYQGTVVALARTGATQSLGPQRDYWVTLDPLPVAGGGSPASPGTDVMTDFVTTWDATTLYAVGQVDFGRKGTAVYAMAALGWVEVARLPLRTNPEVEPPARFGVEASVQDGVLVWHSDHGVSWFVPATFRGGFVATSGRGPVNAIASVPLMPIDGGRFLWWGGRTGETIPSTHQALSRGALLTLP
jgi:RNA polymerase sigma factor (sigma-70 family)